LEMRTRAPAAPSATPRRLAEDRRQFFRRLFDPTGHLAGAAPALAGSVARPQEQETTGTPASLFGVAAAAMGASSRAVKIGSWVGLFLEVAAGAAAWHFGSHGAVVFLVANALAALHIPFYYLLNQRGPPGSVRTWQYVVPFVLFNVYALAAILIAHAFAPAALIMFAVAAVGQTWYDIRQIPSLTNARAVAILEQRQRDAEFVRERLQELIIPGVLETLIGNRAQPLDNEHLQRYLDRFIETSLRRDEIGHISKLLNQDFITGVRDAVERKLSGQYNDLSQIMDAVTGELRRSGINVGELIERDSRADAVALAPILTCLKYQMVPDNVPVYRGTARNWAGRPGTMNPFGSDWGVAKESRAYSGPITIRSTFRELRQAGTVICDRFSITSEAVTLIHRKDAVVSYEEVPRPGSEMLSETQKAERGNYDATGFASETGEVILKRRIATPSNKVSPPSDQSIGGVTPSSTNGMDEAAFLKWTNPVFQYRHGRAVAPRALFDRNGTEMGSQRLSEAICHFRPEDFELELFEKTRKGDCIYLARTISDDPSKRNLFVVFVDPSGELQYVGWPIQLGPDGGQINFTVTRDSAVMNMFRQALERRASIVEEKPIQHGLRMMKGLLDPAETAEFQRRAYRNPVLRHLLTRLRQEAPGQARLTGLFHIGYPESGGSYQPWTEGIFKADDSQSSEVYAHEITHFIHYRLLHPDAAVRALIDRRINRTNHSLLFHFLETHPIYNAHILKDMDRRDAQAEADPSTYQTEALAFLMGTLAQGKVMHDKSRYRIAYGDFRLLFDLGLLPAEYFGRAASVQAADDIPLPPNFFDRLARGETPTPAIESMTELKRYRSTSDMGSLIPQLLEQGWVSPDMVKQFVTDNLSFFRGVESHHDAGDLFELIAFYSLNPDSTEHLQQLRQHLVDTLNDENQCADAIRLFIGVVFDVSLAGKILAHTKGLAPDSLSKLAKYAESALSSLSSQPQSENGSFTNAFHQAVALGYAISNLYRVIGNDAKADAALKEALELESMEIFALAGATANRDQTPSQKLMGEGTEEKLAPQDIQPPAPASGGFEIALARGESMTEAVRAGKAWLKFERWILPAFGVVLMSLSALGIASLPILGLDLSILTKDRAKQSLILGLYSLPGILSGFAFHLPPELAVAAILLSAVFGLAIEEFHTIHDRNQFHDSLLKRGGLHEIASNERDQEGKPILHDPAVLDSSMIPDGRDRATADEAKREVNQVRTALEAIHQSA